MADTAISAVLSKLGELAANEANLLIQVGDDLMLLRDRLEWLQAFVRDADRKRRAGADGLTRVWVRQTRDVAFEAEDALDEFFYQVDPKTQGYRNWKIWCTHLMGFGSKIVVRHELSNRIKRIKNISENQKEYKIEHTPTVGLTTSTTALAAWRDDNNAVGFDADVKSLEQMLLREAGRELLFITIVGESGVGKRTLGKVISAKMKEKFDILVRFNQPPGGSTKVFLHEVHGRILVECAKQNKNRIVEEENADDSDQSINIPDADKIRLLLSSKRYLAIVSGITSKTTLNCLRASLPDDNNGSRVLLIVDTEGEEVAWHANTMNKKGMDRIHQLNRLDETRSGELFRSRVLRKAQSDEEGDPKKYDRIVYDITGGYPLAIVLLAGLLRFKEKPGQWEAVLQQLVPGPGILIEEAQDDGDGIQKTGAISSSKQCPSTRTTLEKVFWESFEDLANDLKSCFLYFATFAKNTVQAADEMVRMWIGEGFIKPHKDKTMEEVGHSYLKELVLRCLVEILLMNASGICLIRVHTSLHGFLQSEVREAGFVEFRDMNDVFVPPSVRRFSFRSFDGRCISFTNKFPKLRSFMCRITTESEDSSASAKDCPADLKFLRGSKFLRLISVIGLKLNKLPDEIGTLVHLRYLRVSCKDLKDLPPSIKRLLNLQTLDIRGTQVENIDPCFWKIKVLRHVLAENLTLPATLEAELEDLQTLHGVKPEGEWNSDKCALHKMTKIRSLKLHGFEHDKHGAVLGSALTKMHLLGRLKLKGDVIPSFIFTDHNLGYLQKIALDCCKVEWAAVTKDVRTVRPNLVQLTLNKGIEVPKHIQDALGEIFKTK